MRFRYEVMTPHISQSRVGNIVDLQFAPFSFPIPTDNSEHSIVWTLDQRNRRYTAFSESATVRVEARAVPIATLSQVQEFIKSARLGIEFETYADGFLDHPPVYSRCSLMSKSHSYPYDGDGIFRFTVDLRIVL